MGRSKRKYIHIEYASITSNTSKISILGSSLCEYLSACLTPDVIFQIILTKNSKTN